ncbi:MAG: hypothetical protein ACRC2U_05130, partial [Aeromonas sp.]
INPKLEAKVSCVKVVRAVRALWSNNAKRITTHDAYSAGPNTTPATECQVITTCGPDVDTYLPFDEGDSIFVRTEGINYVEILKDKNKDLARFPGWTQGKRFIAPWPFGNGIQHYGTIGHDPIVTTEDGDPVPPGYIYYVAKLDPTDGRDWQKDVGLPTVRVKIRCHVYSIAEYELFASVPDAPTWATAVGAQQLAFKKANSGQQDTNLVMWSASIEVTALYSKVSYAGGSRLLKPELYDFHQPPADLAANLRAAQNWLPYEGTIERVGLGILPSNQVGAQCNIANLLPEHATMRALVASHEINTRTNEITYELGAPDREKYYTKATRFRASGNDNIEFIGYGRTWTGRTGQSGGSNGFYFQAF